MLTRERRVVVVGDGGAALVAAVVADEIGAVGAAAAAARGRLEAGGGQGRRLRLGPLRPPWKRWHYKLSCSPCPGAFAERSGSHARAPVRARCELPSAHMKRTSGPGPPESMSAPRTPWELLLLSAAITAAAAAPGLCTWGQVASRSSATHSRLQLGHGRVSDRADDGGALAGALGAVAWSAAPLAPSPQAGVAAENGERLHGAAVH